MAPGTEPPGREAPLTLAVLAALVPSWPDVEVRLVDESVDPVPLDYPADLVGISLITGCAPRAYQLAAHFRSRGIPVVLGGVHVTILPEEAAKHADSIVVGMAEQTWPRPRALPPGCQASPLRGSSFTVGRAT